ncbi:MAG TPA: UDP-N-acetylmuramoyl-tripeptide--D-alanyl-D-alanine ligase [Eubacteriales bacterium]|nr:UDP-N-acetylmuramoyl-tripeptide--D-alanyl-D-alanine ligase [Eubacteriales bacterium]
MKPVTFSNILAASGGTYFGDDALLRQSATDVVIDSRRATPGALYVPIVGERLDGHAFIEDARKNGASLVLSAHPLEHEPYILVGDTLRALQAIASWYRDQFTIPVVGLTGSVGKTSTKEMIASVLSSRYRVLKTLENNNSQTGVPQMLFMLDDTHEAAVLEMGMNHFGEMGRLAAMIKPDVCLFTNIGVAHIENFGSRENILKSKTEMLSHMKKGGKVIANGDDDMLATIPGAFRFGFGESCDLVARDAVDEGLSGVSFTACYQGECLRVHVPAPGMHSVSNALAAMSVGLTLGMQLSELAEGIAAISALPGRMQIVKTKRFTILDDTYNANTVSMMAAVDVLEKEKTRRVCILGDMLELGRESSEHHEVLGMYAAIHGIDLIICVGPESEDMFLGAIDVAPRRARYFETQKNMLALLPGLLRDGDTILVKASRGMHLEKTVEFLKGL